MAKAGLVAVVIVALVIRLAFLAAVNPFWWDQMELKKHSFPDAREYQGLAENFTKDVGKGMLRPFINYNTLYKTPAYPAFLSAIYITTGFRFWVVMLIQIIMDTAVCAMIYAIASRLTSNPYAPTLAAMLYAIDPLPIYYATTLMTETVFGLCSVAAIYLVFKAHERGWTLRHVIAAGVLFGLAAYFRYVGVYLPLVIAAAIPFSRGLREKGARRVLTVLLAFLLAYSATLAPWQYRNYKAYGSYTLGTYLGYNVCYMNAGYTISWLGNVSYQKAVELCKVKGDRNPVSQAEKQFNIGLGYIIGHPGDYLRVHVRGMFDLFWNRPDIVPRRVWEIYGSTLGGYGVEERVFYLLVGAYVASLILGHIIFSVIGIGTLVLERKSMFAGAVIFGAIVYFINVTSIHGSSTHIDRYYFPILPFITVLAGVGMSYALARVMDVWAPAEGERAGE